MIVKVLLDTCVWGGVARELRASGYDVVWAGEWTEDPGDAEILERANAEGRILITLDKDFGELAVLHGTPHRGIARLVDFSSKQQVLVCKEILFLHTVDLLMGAIITAEPGRLRIRAPLSERIVDEGGQSNATSTS